MSRPYIAYLRVSTGKQAQSGLGIEAQREAIAAHIARSGGSLVAEVYEIESGRRDDRPRLAEALALCRVHHATLVIARLDRLARSVAFISHLMGSGVDFVACDFPEANRLTVHILAAVAEHERELISQRTKAALAAAKARGVALGGHRQITPIGREKALHGAKKGAEATRSAANSRASDLASTLAAIRADHIAVTGSPPSLAIIAGALNARGIPTPRGSSWSKTQVRRLLARAV